MLTAYIDHLMKLFMRRGRFCLSGTENLARIYIEIPNQMIYIFESRVSLPMLDFEDGSRINANGFPNFLLGKTFAVSGFENDIPEVFQQFIHPNHLIYILMVIAVGENETDIIDDMK